MVLVGVVLVGVALVARQNRAVQVVRS